MGVVLERVLGDVSEVELGELLALVRTACEGLTPQGRPLYAAHSGLAWPDDPRVALWHAAGLVREHRGDGHIAVLLAAGLDPVESLVLNGLFADNTAFLKTTRGWTDEEWSTGEQRLVERGLVADGALTSGGCRLPEGPRARHGPTGSRGLGAPRPRGHPAGGGAGDAAAAARPRQRHPARMDPLAPGVR